MKILTTIFAALLLSCFVSAQVAPDKYWIRFTDKDNSPYSINIPEEFLSQKAIDRRTIQGISIVENDLPVNPSYVTAVINTGATLLNISKWFNSVTVYTDDPLVLVAINALPIVLSISKNSLSNIVAEEKSAKPFFENETISKIPEENLIKGTTSGQSYDYGQAYNQINMVNGIPLHDLGLDGAGMIIAVLDAGFLNVDEIEAFDSLWLNNQIIGYKDFVSPFAPDIFDSHYHGTMVLSTMGANLPTEMVGTAPKADYWLLRSEDGTTEYLIEELNWASAAEYADSLGADIINSSLGYTTYDDPTQDHTYEDMDGNTTPITIAADLAASKGILVVNSAGNSGNNSWHYIGAPADGDSVFTIGAVNSSGNYASFSSTGPTYDGRIKPNVVAQGQGSTVISAYTGNVTSGNGTSFSSPITAGMVACLWQAYPDKKNTEIMEAIQQSATQAINPDSLLGYGIPDYFAAHTVLSVPVIHAINLDIKVFLEGPFNGTDMDPDLNPILPLIQSYGNPPFNYTGMEEVDEIPGLDIIDWILVELRDAPTASNAVESTIVAQAAGFLKNDGSITDTTGINPLSFNLSITDSLYLVIHHRNHLSVMSAIALKEGIANNWSYDFSIALSKAHGGSSGYKELVTGVNGLVSGDGNADGFIDQQDKIVGWAINAGNMEYYTGDYNCDSQIDNVDKDDFWLPNKIFVGQVPN